jgi:GT2 family glycosyltransferase
MDIKQIAGKYGLLKYTDIESLITKKEPVVTIAMLSYRRPASLIISLKKHLSNGTPMNLCLRVQGSEELSDTIKDEIRDLVSQFYGSHLVFTKNNLGSGIPRHEMMAKALEFDTPYIYTTDDDMLFPEYSIITQVAVLDTLKEYGALGSVCTPSYPRYFIKYGKISSSKVVKSFEDTEMMGSATTLYRREVFDTCEYDKDYQIGLGDFDLCMQMAESGWKLGIMNIKELNSLNDWDPKAKDYIRERYNRPVIAYSKQRFRWKWGIIG